jgi:tRNA threonylcarbamoyl adenosine modification protein (Sua5/YciO/YrdC/YwlC family)
VPPPPSCRNQQFCPLNFLLRVRADLAAFGTILCKQNLLMGNLRASVKAWEQVDLRFWRAYCILISLMETRVAKLDPNKPNMARIKEAAVVVDGGGLVGFPTETVYGIACRVGTDSLDRLSTLKGRVPGKRYTLHISEKHQAKEYVPTIPLRLRKLIERAWPGPLTIVFELTKHDLDRQQETLEPEVFQNLYKGNSIGIRCPDNAIATALLRQTHAPVVAPSANLTDQPPSVEPEQVLAQFSGQIELLLDAGPCKLAKSSTVVKLGKNGLQILRPGACPQEDLRAFSTVGFLFVCTGNTCRSPMAEGIFRKYLAEKLQCKVDQLEDMGYKVLSAGILDMAGTPASMEAMNACAQKEVDISTHRSRTLSREVIEESDFIFAMEQMHCERVVSLCPEAADRCELLAGDSDIADPIGQPQEFFNTCAELIDKAIKQRIAELVI